MADIKPPHRRLKSRLPGFPFSDNRFPEVDLSAVTMTLQAVRYLLVRRLVDAMLGICRQIRPYGACDRPACPRARLALFTSR
jgi:hypothetical protein